MRSWSMSNWIVLPLSNWYVCERPGQRLAIRSSASQELRSEKLEDGSAAHSYVVKDTVTSTLLESMKVNGATITRTDVSADNGVVHVIDKVLVPHFMTL